jgi:site-specific DNA-cytosine methylase
MSLPEDYQLTGTFDQQAERIGRAVAPKMMEALAKSIYEKVLKPYNEAMNSLDD